MKEYYQPIFDIFKEDNNLINNWTMSIKEKVFKVFSDEQESIFTKPEVLSKLQELDKTIAKESFLLSDYLTDKYCTGPFLEKIRRWEYRFKKWSKLILERKKSSKTKSKSISKKTKEEITKLWTCEYINKYKNLSSNISLEDMLNTSTSETFFISFLDFFWKNLISLEEFLESYQDKWIHDFNLEVLFNYHKILEKYKSERLFLFKDFFILNDRWIRVYLLNESMKWTKELEVILEWLKDKRVKRILSPFSLELDESTSKKIKEGIEDEICSNIKDTFDRTKYESWKKYNKKVVQALNLEKRVELKDITEEDFKTVEELNEAWARYKLDVEKVHWISFPRWRYKNSAKNMIIYKDFLQWKVFNKIILVDWRPYWFTTYSYDWKNAYEHWYVTKFFDDTFKIDNSLLKNFFFSKLLEEWVEVVNSWFALNKKLRQFKSIHTKWGTTVNKYVYLAK